MSAFPKNSCLKNHLPVNPLSPFNREIYKYSVPAHTHIEAFSPHNLYPSFEEVVIRHKLCRGLPGKSFVRQISVWKKAKKILANVTLHPKHFALQSAIIFNQAEALAIHPSYFEKVLKLINEWGVFVCMNDGVPYSPVEKPGGYVKQRLLDAVEKSGRKVGRAVAASTASALYRVRHSMPKKFFNYLYIATWFGLRPSELDRCASLPDGFRVVVEQSETFLDIYQGKLGQLNKADRWKRIPVVEVGQRRALALLKAGAFARPDARQVKTYLGNAFGLYSPRKGFVKLMVSRGWQFEAVSRFLGHTTTKTTLAYYTNRVELQTTDALTAIKYRKQRRT